MSSPLSSVARSVVLEETGSLSATSTLASGATTVTAQVVTPKDTITPSTQAPAASCSRFWETSIGKFLCSISETVKSWAQSAWQTITKFCACFGKREEVVPTNGKESVQVPVAPTSGDQFKGNL